MTESPGNVQPAFGVLPVDAELIKGFLLYQRSRALSNSTINHRRLALRRFAKHLAPASMLTATAADVDDWVATHRSAHTKHAYRSHLAMFFRWAISRGLTDSNPVDGTDRVRVPQALPKPASAKAITAALVAAPADLQLALMLGSLAGLRIGEVVSLAATDVHLDVEPPVLMVREGKGGKDRVVPLHPRLVPMLRGHTGWYFPSRQGGHIKEGTLSWRLIQWLMRPILTVWPLRILVTLPVTLLTSSPRPIRP